MKVNFNLHKLPATTLFIFILIFSFSILEAKYLLKYNTICLILSLSPYKILFMLSFTSKSKLKFLFFHLF